MVCSVQWRRSGAQGGPMDGARGISGGRPHTSQGQLTVLVSACSRNEPWNCKAAICPRPKPNMCMQDGWPAAETTERICGASLRA